MENIFLLVLFVFALLFMLWSDHLRKLAQTAVKEGVCEELGR